MKRFAAVYVSALLLSAPLAFSADDTNATATAAAPDMTALLTRIDAIDKKLAELARSVESISKFLGDQRSTTYNTVDQRLDDMKRLMDNTDRSVDDIRRDVGRLR